MTLTTLSAYLDDFLATKRVRAEVDARSGPQRRQLRYTERLLRSFHEFRQASGCPSPIRAALALDWVASHITDWLREAALSASSRF